MELSGQRWGKPSNDEVKPRLTFLHGMGGTGALWRPIAASFEDDFEILALDQRGHGGSRIPFVPGGRNDPSYTPIDYGRDIVETWETLGFHPSWLIGHSMGVRTACAAAHLKPEWTRGLILIDLGFFGAAGGGLGETLAQFLRQLPTEFPSRQSAREFMKLNCPDPSIAQYLMAVSTPGPGGSVTFPFDHAALIRTIEAAKQVSVRNWARELGERGMPILVLRGAESLVWSHEDFAEEKIRFADLPSIRFEEFAGAGHGLPFEKRPEFVARVREFIAENQ